MNYQTIHSTDQEEEEEQYTFNRAKYWLFGLISLPFIYYLFIYLPTSQPERITIPNLAKYKHLPVHLIPLSTYDHKSQLSNHENYNSLVDIKKDEKDKSSKRLILIGDIHGSYTPLISLLNKLNYTSSQDSVLMLGDFLSKGPDSLKVLEFAISENWFGILGNHELSILSKYNNFQEIKIDNDSFLATPKNGKFDKELYIARKLTPSQVDYISSMPLIMGLGPVPFQNSKDEFLNPMNGIASHLGLFPEVSIESQNLTDLLNIDKDWYRDYNSFEKTISKKDRNVVYYGHHASLGLNLKKYSKGLDSGCVYGGELSAMVIWVEEISKKQVVYKQELISVKC